MRLCRDRDQSEDLVQDAMLRAMLAWDKFPPGDAPLPWLRRILLNEFISDYRRHKWDSIRDAQFALCADRWIDPDHRTDLGDEVTAALSALDPNFRKVLEGSILRSQSYRDAATQMSVPIGTIMSRLHRARRAMRASLIEYARSEYGIGRAA